MRRRAGDPASALLTGGLLVKVLGGSSRMTTGKSASSTQARASR
jgi:hypothetical protein